MSLFEPRIPVELTLPELEAFARLNTATEKPGGWQTLHDKILKRYAEAVDLLTAFLEDDELIKVQHYAFTGHGGYQNAFKIIYHAAVRAGWKPKP